MGVLELVAHEVMSCTSQIVIDNEHYFPVDRVVGTPHRVGNRQRQEPDKGALKRIRKLDADCLMQSFGPAPVGRNIRRSPKHGRPTQVGSLDPTGDSATSAEVVGLGGDLALGNQRSHRSGPLVDAEGPTTTRGRKRDLDKVEPGGGGLGDEVRRRPLPMSAVLSPNPCSTMRSVSSTAALRYSG